jgi:hypothetical protein
METTALKARIASPAFVVPGAMNALMAMDKAISRVHVSQQTLAPMHPARVPDQRRLQRVRRDAARGRPGVVSATIR